MKSVKIIVAVFLLVTSPVVLESCFCTCGGCSNDGPPHYDFQDMKMHLYALPEYFEPPTTPISLSKVVFDVEIVGKRTSSLQMSTSAAYACSPAPNVANQQISSIVITSNNDFVGTPATLFKGENLSLAFYVQTEMGRYSISEILNKQFLGSMLTFASESELETAQSHVFTFHITISDGQEYEMVTKELNFLAD